MTLADTHLAIMNMLAEQMTYDLVPKIRCDDERTISYTHNAPVMSGQRWATLVINDDLSINLDGDCHFADLEAWLECEREYLDSAKWRAKTNRRIL